MVAKLKRKENFENIAEKEFNQIQQREKHLKLVEGKKKTPTDYFYQVSNPGELTRIGQSFLADFKSGVKSFAISSTDYKSAQQRTVLALACYFDHLFDLKILIISDSLHKGIFTDVMVEKTTENYKIPNTSKTIELNHFHHHFDLVELADLLHINKSAKPSFEFENAVQNLIKEYDVVFWDTPTINTYKQNPTSYNQTLTYFESLTIIVAQNVTYSKDINELKDYFSSFGVNIKGVLFDTLQMEKDKKKKWWSIF